jgi:UDP-galactopyranose mutase
MFDDLIVGAGFAGSVLAERLASIGRKVLIVDKRTHIGGNAFDKFDDAGILIHPYGPHIFHTNSLEVFDYLSRFTAWRPYQHRVLASVDGQELPIPINLDTVNRMYNLNLTSFELEDFFANVAEKREKILTSEDVVIAKVRSIQANSMPASPLECRHARTGMIGTSPTPTRRCRCTGTPACLRECWRTRTSRS